MATPGENPPLVDNQNRNPLPDAPPPIPPRLNVTATIRGAHQQQRNLGGPQLGNQQAPNNNNAGEMPQQTQNLFYMRDRLFLALFFRVTLIYARAFPKTLRRLLEFFLLMQSIVLLFLLCYIHIVYTRTPITCLNKYKDSWPRDGILRVEITTDAGDDYDIAKSYEKEEKLRQRVAATQLNNYGDDIISMMFSADQLLLDRVVSTAGGFISSVTNSQQTESTEDDANVNPTKESSVPNTETTTTAEVEIPPKAPDESPPEVTSSEGTEEASTTEMDVELGSNNNKSSELDEDSHVAAAEGEDKASEGDASSFPHTATASGEGSTPETGETDDPNNPNSPYFNKTLEEIEIMKMEEKQLEEEKVLKSSVSDLEMLSNVFMLDQAYIVEYALEYGFLRLTPETRQRLNIPVKIVTLDPTKESCFGDSFSVFLLENFLGYDDILMSSIKNLAEVEESKGYLRNVVTGEQFRFVPMWMARTSYIPAMLIMLVFTVSISMLLRYSHHQIFIFIVDLLNNIEGAGSIHIPAAPLFTVILALVGMEAIMSEFFNDTSTAFYVILIVWIADQYDSVCSHTAITKTFWVRFFYLYHFAFYAYHYRFNGQYSGLALLVSWSFIQHSMVYFYHHYELPAILRQAQQPEIPAGFFNDGQSSPSSASSGSGNGTPDSAASSQFSGSSDAAAAASTTMSSAGDGSSREQPLQPAPPTSAAGGGESNSGSSSNSNVSNITVTLSSSSPDSEVPPVSVQISSTSSTSQQQAFPSSGGEESSSNELTNQLRRRVTPGTTLSSGSTSNFRNNESFSSSTTSPSSSSILSNEVRSFMDDLRSSSSSTSNQQPRFHNTGVVPPSDFSTRVSVSFSADPISTASSAGSRGADVSSLLSNSMSGGGGSGAAGVVYNPVTRL